MCSNLVFKPKLVRKVCTEITPGTPNPGPKNHVAMAILNCYTLAHIGDIHMHKFKITKTFTVDQDLNELIHESRFKARARTESHLFREAILDYASRNCADDPKIASILERISLAEAAREAERAEGYEQAPRPQYSVSKIYGGGSPLVWSAVFRDARPSRKSARNSSVAFFADASTQQAVREFTPGDGAAPERVG